MNSINEWAAKSTDGKLPEVTKDVQNPDGALIVNAMFFKREYKYFLLLKAETKDMKSFCRCVTFYILSNSSLG